MNKTISIIFTIIMCIIAQTKSFANEENNKNNEEIEFIQYKRAIQKAISKSWYKDETFENGWLCKVNVKQNRRGILYIKDNPTCNTKNEKFIKSVSEAVERLYKLPKARDSFFSEEITLNFYQK